ncbi:hypothetical protein D3C74_329440 [compost metagenome]
MSGKTTWNSPLVSITVRKASCRLSNRSVAPCNACTSNAPFIFNRTDSFKAADAEPPVTEEIHNCFCSLDKLTFLLPPSSGGTGVPGRNPPRCKSLTLSFTIRIITSISSLVCAVDKKQLRPSHTYNPL